MPEKDDGDLPDFGPTNVLYNAELVPLLRQCREQTVAPDAFDSESPTRHMVDDATDDVLDLTDDAVEVAADDVAAPRRRAAIWCAAIAVTALGLEVVSARPPLAVGRVARSTEVASRVRLVIAGTATVVAGVRIVGARADIVGAQALQQIESLPAPKQVSAKRKWGRSPFAKRTH